jgi:hypothetical protein
MNRAVDKLYSKFKDLEDEKPPEDFGGYQNWILPGAAVGTVAAAGAGAWWAKGRRRETPFERAEHKFGFK